ARVELGIAHNVDAEPVAVRPCEPADDLSHVFVQCGVVHQVRRCAEGEFGAIHLHPEPSLVAPRCGSLAGLEAHGGASHESEESKRDERGCNAPGHMVDGHLVHNGNSVKRRCTDAAASSSVRRSPPPSWLRLNQSTFPVPRSMRDAIPVWRPEMIV